MTGRLARRIEDIQREVERARAAVKVLEEQVQVWDEALDEMRLRSLVSETPQVSADYDDVARHASVAKAELQRRRSEVGELVERRDELLRQWTPEGTR